ncbi:hypothetical protein FB561_6936 [Kribbella amoyensis]|uniref:Uncharacterized protein n=1 Tax=Kribbella amoyensis TaxID=996641 RepID=A0A561B2G6_9ACTN|nr:hypothetical protein FB561_6936 [Kribbella amoyensis]
MPGTGTVDRAGNRDGGPCREPGRWTVPGTGTVDRAGNRDGGPCREPGRWTVPGTGTVDRAGNRDGGPCREPGQWTVPGTGAVDRAGNRGSGPCREPGRWTGVGALPADTGGGTGRGTGRQSGAGRCRLAQSQLLPQAATYGPVSGDCGCDRRGRPGWRAGVDWGGWVFARLNRSCCRTRLPMGLWAVSAAADIQLHTLARKGGPRTRYELSPVQGWCSRRGGAVPGWCSRALRCCSGRGAVAAGWGHAAPAGKLTCA